MSKKIKICGILVKRGENNKMRKNKKDELQKKKNRKKRYQKKTAVKSTTEKQRVKKKVAVKKRRKYSLKEAFCTKNKLIILALSIALGFTVFFFSPMDIFLGNQREFIVEFKYAALSMLGASAVASLFVAGLCVLFLLICEPLFAGFSRLLFGFLLAIYSQSLFFNSRMASITGDDVSYTDNMTSSIINVVIFCVIMILPLILHILARFLKNNKVLNFGKGMIVPYVSGLIFVMQLVGTGSSILSTDFSKYKKFYTKYLAIEPTLSLSKEDNVVVFLTDRLDSLWMDEVLERYPEMSNKLEGFTFYQNNISHNTNTFPAVPQMLTNCFYKGEEWADYTSKAWDGDTVPRILTENGYDVNLLIDNLTTYSSLAQLDGQCSNLDECSPDIIDINYMGAGGIIPTMTRLSCSKLSPYILKSEFTAGMGSNLSQNFVRYTKEIPDLMPMSVGVESDLTYYKYLKDHGLNADNKNKTFSFVHLNCSHGDSFDLMALYNRLDTLDVYSTTRGDFQIIFKYIDEMKRLGIYDNSTIIILGDHGRAPVEIEVDDKPGLTSAITTALLVKPKNAPKEELKLDSISELSNDFFPASVLEYAGIDHKELGYSYNDVIDGGLHPDRYMQTFDWHGFGKVVYKAYYKVTGDARDFDNWEILDGHE